MPSLFLGWDCSLLDSLKKVIVAEKCGALCFEWTDEERQLFGIKENVFEIVWGY